MKGTAFHFKFLPKFRLRIGSNLESLKRPFIVINNGTDLSSFHHIDMCVPTTLWQCWQQCSWLLQAGMQKGMRQQPSQQPRRARTMQKIQARVPLDSFKVVIPVFPQNWHVIYWGWSPKCMGAAATMTCCWGWAVRGCYSIVQVVRLFYYNNS